VTDIDVAETAAKALAILDRDGWNKGATSLSPGSSEPYRVGSHCLGGAWNLAATGRAGWSHDTSIYLPVTDVILAQYPDLTWLTRKDPPRMIICLNDMDQTTEDDVRAILEKLAAG
jgi:hypothetical protein